MIPLKKNRIYTIGATLLVLLGFTACNSGGEKNEGGVKDLLGLTTLTATETDSLYIRDYIVREKQLKEHEELIYLFYGERDYRLGWFKDDELLPQSEKLLTTIGEA